MRILIALISFAALLVNQDSFGAPTQPIDNGQTIFKCKNVSGAYVYQGTPCPQDYSTLSSWKAEAAQKPPSAPSTGPVSFTIQLSPQGQYKTQGSVNSVPLVFQIDTGANYVSIPQDIAAQAKMTCKAKVRTETANGTAMQCVSIIDKMTFGSFQIERVAAMIAPNLKQPLLGMNVLKMFRVEHDEGVMKISYKNL